MFPGIELPEHNYGILQSSIEDAARNRNLQVVPSQIKKVIQLYETMLVRHGLMLVGPTGGGKTTCYEVSLVFIVPTDIPTAILDIEGCTDCFACWRSQTSRLSTSSYICPQSKGQHH